MTRINTGPHRATLTTRALGTLRLQSIEVQPAGRIGEIRVVLNVHGVRPKPVLYLDLPSVALLRRALAETPGAREAEELLRTIERLSRQPVRINPETLAKYLEPHPRTITGSLESLREAAIRMGRAFLASFGIAVPDDPEPEPCDGIAMRCYGGPPVEHRCGLEMGHEGDCEPEED